MILTPAILESLNSSLSETFTAYEINDLEEVYLLIDPNKFYTIYNDILLYEVSDSHYLFVEYNDLLIRSGKIMAYLKDYPVSKSEGIITKLDPTNNTIAISKKYWNDSNSIEYLYKFNNINTDWELFTSGYIIVPREQL